MYEDIAQFTKSGTPNTSPISQTQSQSQTQQQQQIEQVKAKIITSNNDNNRLPNKDLLLVLEDVQRNINSLIVSLRESI